MGAYQDLTSATILADSISPRKFRLVTLQVTFPRFVLAEFNTHRVFSRNFRSSRAVPTKVLIQEVLDTPVVPEFGKNQPGMQAKELIEAQEVAHKEWFNARNNAVDSASYLMKHGVHKQVINRILEPFMWVHGVVSSTEWDNFFNLRCHVDAQPEIQVLAYKMKEAIEGSTPVQRGDHEWHLPYVTDKEREVLDTESLLRVSASRCARVSYKPFGSSNPSTMADDLELFEKLAGAHPKHLSPLEHQAAANTLTEFDVDYYASNFRGWDQFRTGME